ncbi:MAG TPA: DUF423 domain-containing protein [Halieaceae bacterium]|uniref:DUF423 domain-containing protein n=1 Tax=Pseudohaliea sp. TaxID=2740289 RepID=UPI000EC2DE65|nr:DUF423 domain-containing protein [Halieaceae bacterium]
MAKLFLSLGALAGLLAVALGAFGAHALRGRLDEYARGVFETAVQYHFYHALALALVGVLLLSQPATALLKSSGWLFLIGIAVFSGSLYLLAITGIKWLGAVTPLGGLAFIAGWGCLAAAAWKLLP